MKSVFLSFKAGEKIPVEQFLSNKKLKKYFNRETEAAIIAMGMLCKEVKLDPETPFYYSLGSIEFEDYGLCDIVEGSIDSNGSFSDKLFVENGLPKVSPLNQFKVLQNMPLSFISIVFGLKGDNAVLYSSANGLLVQAVFSDSNESILLGASKAYSDGKVEAGIALADKREIIKIYKSNLSGEAINLFRYWAFGDYI